MVSQGKKNSYLLEDSIEKKQLDLVINAMPTVLAVCDIQLVIAGTGRTTSSAGTAK